MQNASSLISLSFPMFCIGCLCWGAELEMADIKGGGLSWRSPDAWYLNKGEPKEEYPTAEDDVKIMPQYNTSNFYLALQLPTGNPTAEIRVNSIDALIGASVDLQGNSGVERFIVAGIFKKTAESETKKGKMVALHDGNMAIGPANMDSFLHVELGGDVILKDDASDRTSIMAFGGNDVYSAFRTHRLLASFVAKKDIVMANHMLFIGTENGINATINGIVKFEPSANGRPSVFVLNGDNGDEAWQQLQTVKVGGLSSFEDGAGVIATRTAAQRFPTEEQLKRLPSDFKSDNVIRHGNLEIIGPGGTFSGEIRDNLRQEDKRGRVNVTMNSPGGKQYLIGKNLYGGNTYVLAGFLGIKVFEPLEKVFLRGGVLSLYGDSPEIRDFEWSGGSIEFDLKKNKVLTISGDVAIKTPPDKKDYFVFSNIVPSRNITLLESKGKTDAFRLFEGKSLAVSDADTGKKYEAVFGVSDTSLTVMFILK